MAYVAGEVAPAMKPNYVLRSWREGGQNLGAWLDSPDAFITENMGTRAESVHTLAPAAALAPRAHPLWSC